MVSSIAAVSTMIVGPTWGQHGAARCKILLAGRQRHTVNWVHIEGMLTAASVTETMTEATSRKSEAIEI
jgi:hypothetical protein